MAMEEDGTMRVASRMNTAWDLRDVPLERLNDCAEAKQLVNTVIEAEDGASLVVAAGFNSAI
jgi:hypothetical protein